MVNIRSSVRDGCNRMAEGLEAAEVLWSPRFKRRFLPYAGETSQPLPKVSLHLPTYNEPPEMVKETLDSLARLAGETDIAVVEGNRGLFDGIDARGTHATAELAKHIGAPVVLVVDAVVGVGEYAGPEGLLAGEGIPDITWMPAAGAGQGVAGDGVALSTV